jgi:hypothetical protein
LDFLLSPAGQKLFNESFAYGSGAQNYGFEKFYPEQEWTMGEYSDCPDESIGLMEEITEK